MERLGPRIHEMPLAPGGIHRDFEADVLERLRKHGAAMHGCPVESVECKLDGAIAVWFAGPRDGVPWRGALRLNFGMLNDAGLIGDTANIADVALHALSQIREGPGVIHRERA